MNRLVAFLSSLQLAVILLVLLLIGLATGTIIESRAGSEVAGRLVYYSPWFLGLQFLFAINVAMSISSLFPWGRMRTGFLIVHSSLLLIFAGSAITYFLKTEGRLALWEGETNRQIAQYDDEGHVLSSHDLPFSVKLDDFVLETYPGTMRPSGFKSLVQITDLDTGHTFPAQIWMNHEFHHRGYALFQSSYSQANGRERTVLSVVSDPGQNVVFAGYILVVLGMIVVLSTRIQQARFLAAVQERQAARRPPGGKAASRVAALLLTLIAARAFALTDAQVDTLRKLPVQHDGRSMPLDTYAREAVWKITGQYAWNGEPQIATVTGWLFDPQAAADLPVVSIGSSRYAIAVGLPSSTTHASFNQLVGNPRVLQLAQAARQQSEANVPREGATQDAEKLEERLIWMQNILKGESVRPTPFADNPNARWGLPPELAPAVLTAVASGPRLPGWPSAEQIDREILYNKVNPVRLSWIILLISLLFSVFGWSNRGKLIDVAAFVFLLGGFATMTWGIAMRWLAADRIPAANMYESMLFLAWGVGLFAVVAYAVMRNKLVVLNAAVMATLTMALTDLLPIDRFIHPVPPVLAGTAWLAIHVPIIMVGYAVLALGMVIAHMQVGFEIFAAKRREAIARMYELLYWYTFIGSILLLAGILTGSMWAASSWGRYWGWDPKEVWSLVAFLAYMAIMHAKVNRMIGEFGFAAISIAAFQTIIMTYLGVNFVLTTGMHSYGMGDSPVVKWMVIVALAESLFLGWGWVAYRKNNPFPARPRRAAA